jgi:hypothetical protein
MTAPTNMTSPPRVVTSSACSAARRLAPRVIEADQQVREDARDLPEHHEHDEVVGEDESVHRARREEDRG